MVVGGDWIRKDRAVISYFILQKVWEENLIKRHKFEEVTGLCHAVIDFYFWLEFSALVKRIFHKLI